MAFSTAFLACCSAHEDTGLAAEACDPSVEDWPSDWAEMEVQVLDATNVVRALGTSCGVYGQMSPVDPLTMEPHLRCAARAHALDMGTRDYFSHDGPGGPIGDSLPQRIRNAGYTGDLFGENIAASATSAQDVIDTWVASDSHCSNLMNESYRYIGAGYAKVSGSTYDTYWVQDLGG